jgi:hypothetical protein
VRTVAGLLSQGLAGALGGYIYYRIRSSAPIQPATAP